MLSILIPVYNYNIKSLISSLDKALNITDFDYEILCLEDGSTYHTEENKAICISTDRASHLISKNNNGRITSRKALAQKSKYDWLLFLDADVELKDKTLIENYSKHFNHDCDAIYGGYMYKDFCPASKFMLRWTYGNSFEQVNAKKRNQSPYKVVISGNLLIKKETFLNLNSEIKSDGYGYDNIFGALMKEKNIKVLHINNAVFHNGLDENPVFLTKVEHAVITLYNHYTSNKQQPTDNGLLELYKSMKKVGLHKAVALLFNLSKARIQKQLLGKRPSMRLLQFYKLGYLSSLTH
ncbi:glycosyltransferase family 2 protein [Winogradskyella flava]|uniref:glycosyltransferase family 2 protein n=1 Tax=Winogradskyella flava TaxID=1884876 RepID=UPI002492759A|nr:glycosyltransferase family 2 protein [Winogradskyella flava]